MNRLTFARAAERDLEEIHDYIAQRNPDAALRFIERLERRCQRLRQNPFMGRQREELAPRLRSVSEGSYLVFYRTTDDDVEVIRVVHGARELSKLF